LKPRRKYWITRSTFAGKRYAHGPESRDAAFWADLKVDLSAEEIDEARQEMWRNSSRRTEHAASSAGPQAG
jgi:hypothetical protein